MGKGCSKPGYADKLEIAQPDNNTQFSSASKTFFERETLTCANFNDWYRSLRIVLRVADTYDYLFKPCPDQPVETASEEDKAAWKAEYKKHNDVACLMLGKMSPALLKDLKRKGNCLMVNNICKWAMVHKATDLLGLIHTDVYGPLGHVSRKGASYFLTFTDDFSQVELQLGKKIKAFRSDRGGEYLSQDFKDYLIPPKKVDKTPYEIWHGKAPNMSYLKYGNFLERDLISQKFSGRDNDLKDDHMDTLPSENTSEILVESESLGDLGEPANYKAAMLDPDKVIWQGAMDEEINSMKVMKVWIVVDLPPNAKMHKARCGICSKLSQSISTESREAPLEGFVFVINGGVVDWKSKKQTTIAMHSAQAKYVDATKAAMEAIWIRKFVGDLGVMPSINKPINMYCDNSAAIIFANEPRIMKGARHFLRRYHYVQEQVETGEIKLIKVHTDDNLADPY
nr:putative retrotransposon protein [Tanacetum cinerariifolium]